MYWLLHDLTPMVLKRGLVVQTVPMPPNSFWTKVSLYSQTLTLNELAEIWKVACERVPFYWQREKILPYLSYRKISINLIQQRGGRSEFCVS